MILNPINFLSVSMSATHTISYIAGNDFIINVFNPKWNKSYAVTQIVVLLPTNLVIE